MDRAATLLMVPITALAGYPYCRFWSDYVSAGRPVDKGAFLLFVLSLLPVAWMRVLASWQGWGDFLEEGHPDVFLPAQQLFLGFGPVVVLFGILSGMRVQTGTTGSSAYFFGLATLVAYLAWLGAINFVVLRRSFLTSENRN